MWPTLVGSEGLGGLPFTAPTLDAAAHNLRRQASTKCAPSGRPLAGKRGAHLCLLSTQAREIARAGYPALSSVDVFTPIGVCCPQVLYVRRGRMRSP